MDSACWRHLIHARSCGVGRCSTGMCLACMYICIDGGGSEWASYGALYTVELMISSNVLSEAANGYMCCLASDEFLWSWHTQQRGVPCQVVAVEDGAAAEQAGEEC